MRDKKPAEDIKATDTFKDKYGIEHQVYHNFDVLTSQRAVVTSQMSKFQNIGAGQVTIPVSYDGGKNMWILKPACLSRGRGLELFTDLSQLNEFLKMYIAAGYDAKDYSQIKYSDKLDRSPSLTPNKASTNSSSSPESRIRFM